MKAPTKKALNSKVVMYRKLAAERLHKISDLELKKVAIENSYAGLQIEITELKKDKIKLQTEVFMLTQEDESMKLPNHEEETFAPLKASRFNKGKPELSYILDAPIAMKGLAEVFAMGTEKYERDNWKKGLDKNEIIDSLIRHLMAFKSGEQVDSESGKCHTHHVHWNALVLAEQFCSGCNREK